MIRVSDTTAITNLVKINHLFVMRKLLHHIHIPVAVYHELTSNGVNMPGCREVQNANWITVAEVRDKALLKSIMAIPKIDAGEAEAIALASELYAELIVIDEAVGRRVAKERGLSIVGVLGLLIKAKQQGLIKAVRPLAYQLKNEAQMYLDTKFIENTLKAIGE